MVKMSDRIIVSVNEGKIRGIKQSSGFSGVEFYSFFGIPYGQPPINTFRFKDPVKVKPWADLYDATTEKQGCVQFSLFTCQYLGTEDCLFNNIHTPKLPRKNEPLRPVIVNIHPGAYIFGTPQTQLYGSPEFVMHHDVVYVNISYRLHILGFLNLKLKECSGNQGIKDIVLSLHWIKNNISSFGGDPDNVTLIGSSSGSVIVHILMLSPAARGLFHKAILMGAYFNNPVVPHKESNVDHARKLAKILGYSGNLQDDRKILIFLKKQEPLLLIEAFRRCQMDLQETIAPIYPICVFSPSLDGGDILPKSPRNLTKSMARIPIMIGYSQNESIMGFVRKLKENTERNFKNSLRQNQFGWGYHLNDEDIQSIYKEVEAFYLNGQPVEQASSSMKMDIQTDIAISDVYNMIINPISEHLPSSVFVYKFEFEGNIYTINDILKNVTQEPIKGTSHGCDFCYWNHFGEPENYETYEMVETFTKLITTFCRKGDPNYETLPVQWKPCTPDKPCYLSINNPFSMVEGKLNNKRLEFWEKIQQKYTKSNDIDIS